MKKLVTLVIIMFSVLAMAGCGIKGKEVLYIESNKWEMRAVMSNNIESVTNEDNLVVAVGEADKLYPNVKIVDLLLTASGGEITLVDATNDKTYSGNYQVTEETSKGITYEITIDGITGYATLSPTEYYSGTEIPTLPIIMGEYSLYFIPNEATSK